MKKVVFALLLIAGLLLAGCGARADAAAHTRTVLAMDTVMTLTAYGENADAALAAAETEIRRLDALLARGEPESAVYALNHNGYLDADSGGEVEALLTLAAELADATDGAFDPTVALLLELWGFGGGAEKHRVPSPEELDVARSFVGMGHVHRSADGQSVTLDLPAQIDFGGVAKGFTGARAIEILRERGVTGATLDLGGDVALLGAKPDGSAWRVAVRDPADGEAYLGVLETAGDVFVMTSGVYERYFEENGVRYHHILDPKTGRPADSGLVSATVVCADGAWADALATACCVLGEDGALALRAHLADTTPFDLILVTDDARVRCTTEAFAPETGNGYTYELIG